MAAELIAEITLLSPDAETKDTENIGRLGNLQVEIHQSLDRLYHEQCGILRELQEDDEVLLARAT